MRWILIFLLATSLISSNTFPFKFPKINTQMVNGMTVSDDYFNRGKTMVILMHLGCPPAMLLIKDLQQIDQKKLNGYQILIVAENTKEQIELFNSNESNLWSTLRKNFGLDSIAIDIIAECETENIQYQNGDTIIGQQCRNISKKLFTNTSPTIYFIDENRKINRTEKGYYFKSNLDYLESLINGK